MSETGKQAVPHATIEERAELRISWLMVLGTAAALLVVWLLYLFVLTDAGAAMRGKHPALPPLYVQWFPKIRREAAAFAALALALVFAAPRLCDSERSSRRTFLLALLAASVLLPLALFAARDDIAHLGQQLERPYEFYSDAQRIDDAGAFLAGYVAKMPELSLHGQHFPPGHVLFLYAIGKLFGTGSLTAALAVLASFALGIALAFLALTRLTSETGARQGALLVCACPALLDHACVSMDAVFFLWASLSWWLALRAFAERGRIPDAILCGVVLLVASSFSFSALPLGLSIALYACFSGRRALRRTALRLFITGASYFFAFLLLEAITGFDLYACLHEARRSALELLTNTAGEDPRRLYGLTSYGNAASYLVGAGVALAACAAIRLRQRAFFAEAWTPAALATLLVMTAGGIYSMETERIWLFAMPWLAAIGLSAGPVSPSALRNLLAAGLLQSLAMETLLFTWW